MGTATPPAPRTPTAPCVSLQAAVDSCLSVGLQLEVTGCSLKKPQQAKRRFQDKPATTVPKAPQLPAPSGDRATKVPRSRAARERLPPLEPQSSSCLPKSGPPALPQLPYCSAGSQELPWLLHLVKQPEEAQPTSGSCPMDRVPGPATQGAPRSSSRSPGYSAGDQELPWFLHLLLRQPEEAQAQEAQPQEALPPLTCCPLDRRPVPPPWGATRNPWQPLGGSAGSQELPWLLHLVGQPEDAEPEEAHTQESQPKATLSPINSRPLDRFSPLQEVRGRALLPAASCARSPGLPQLSQAGGQPQAALPLISARAPVTGAVAQARRAPSRPWQPSGCVPAPAGLPAGSVRLSAL